MRSMRLTALAATALLCAGLAACSASVTVGSSPSATTATGTQTYTDGQYGYSLSYPAAWQETGDVAMADTAGSGAASNRGFMDPRGTKVDGKYIDGVIVGVYPLTTTITPDLMPQVKKELLNVVAQLKSGIPDFAGQKLKPVTVNGARGYSLAFTATQSGTPTQSVTYFLFKGDKEYQLIGQAAQADWSGQVADLQATMDSFTAK